MPEHDRSPDSRLNRASGHLTRAQELLAQTEKIKQSSKLRVYRPTSPSVILERDSKGVLRVVKPQVK